MFKVSHELPINMLDQSYDINDYEYCLPHLLDQNETYKNHFYQAKKDGRYIVMDKMGAESCAKLVYDKFNDVMSKTGGGRVKVVKVECWEADRNSSIYTEI